MNIAIYGVILAIIIELAQGPYDILAILLLFGLVGFLVWKYGRVVDSE